MDLYTLNISLYIHVTKTLMREFSLKSTLAAL